MNTIKNILVHVDYSDSSLNAIKAAIAMCKRQQAALHLLDIIDNDIIVLTGGMNLPVINIADEIYGSKESNLETLAKSIAEKHQIQCFVHLETGLVSNSLCRAAEDFDIDLIVIGNTPGNKMGMFFSGCAAWNVVKAAPCPVLTIPAHSTSTAFRKVLFPVRPVDGIMKKFAFIKPILQQNKSALFLYGMVNGTTGFKTVRALVNKLEYEACFNNATISSEFYNGNNYAEATTTKAGRLKSDLIVLTTGTASGLTGLFKRKYAHKVVTKSTVPVLTVKAGNDIQPGRHQAILPNGYSWIWT